MSEIPILDDMQIRKAKREEQLSKRRNVCVLEDGELLGPDQDDIVSSSGMSPGAGVLVPNASSPQQEIVTLDPCQTINFLYVLADTQKTVYKFNAYKVNPVIKSLYQSPNMALRVTFGRILS